MAAKNQRNNNVIRSIPRLDASRHGSPNAQPDNFTFKSPQPQHYGRTRGPSVFQRFFNLFQDSNISREVEPRRRFLGRF